MGGQFIGAILATRFCAHETHIRLERRIQVVNAQTQASPRRQLSEDVAQRRHANALVRPFLTRFEDWNHRAAKASTHALSHLTSIEEKAAQEHLLTILYSEVDVASQEFEETVAGQPPHGRIDDIRNAFARLRENLRPWRVRND
jgi:hypothetical protein